MVSKEYRQGAEQEVDRLILAVNSSSSPTEFLQIREHIIELIEEALEKTQLIHMLTEAYVDDN